jgi:1-deoxy-D-xylulose-5-phosphate reductoisomerase
MWEFMKEIVILGSTGSIGVQALEIIASHPESFRVVALAAGSGNLELLARQGEKFKVPILATTGDKARLQSLTSAEVIDGPNSASQVAAIPADIVLNAITGSIGLGPTLAALSSGNKVALANKESLVAGGELVMSYGRDRILPVDSEHSALAQAMRSGKRSEISKLVLTASGGPFRDRKDLSDVTVGEALAHPTWKMGPVVTINSATLVNKGLEVIEAHHLFGIPYKQIEAVIHPQSVVHSMVEFRDGSTIAQASPPDMKGPIAYAISSEERYANVMRPIDWSTAQTWEFSPIDDDRFPAVELAKRCGELGTSVTAMYNAANEEAVGAFVEGRIAFTRIVEIVEAVVMEQGGGALSPLRDIDDVTAIEHDARVLANELIRS